MSNFSSSSPASTTDCSRFSVPSTFAATVSYGRCHDSPTCAWAPRWKTYGRSGAVSFSSRIEVVDRRAVGEVREVDLEAAAQVADVVQRAARGRADECVHGRAELDERVREVRAHEAVGARDEDGAPVVDVPELAAEVVERGACPESVVRHGPYASASVSKRTDSSGLGSCGEAALTAASTLVVSSGSRRSSASSSRASSAVPTRRTASSPRTASSSSSCSPRRRSASPCCRRLSRARDERRLAGDGRRLRDRAGAGRRCRCSSSASSVLSRLARRPDRGRLRDRRGTRAPTRCAGWSRPRSRTSSPVWRRAPSRRSTTTRPRRSGTRSGARPGSRYILTRVGADGIVAVSWGMALNGALALARPAVGLAWRARTRAMPRRAVRPVGAPLRIAARRVRAAAAIPADRSAALVRRLRSRSPDGSARER